MTPKFEFEKTIGLHALGCDKIDFILDNIAKLLICMKETNKFHDKTCEYFRLEFRPPNFYEAMSYPLGSLILDMKWGCKSEEVAED